MTEKVLVTGGAGFIGRHLVQALLERDYEVKVYDNLEPQVHGENPNLNFWKDVEFIKGDIRDADLLRKAIKNVAIIFHQAAAVGVGQSMYQIQKYVDVNIYGTAVLLDIIVNEKKVLRKFIVASSMSIYGEGEYLCDSCGKVYPKLRDEEQLKRRDWEMKCPRCKQEVKANPTTEDKPLHPTSVYAISKRDQEEMALCIGRAYGIPTVALRYFNGYGPGQALSNPYTGVAAIFSSRILNNKPPLIFEDGLQSRDFIHVKDIVQANLLALEKDNADYEALNVGTGVPTSILTLARLLMKKLDFEGEPVILGKYRIGDIRHCYADITRIRERLGFQPTINLEDGIEDLINWVQSQKAVDLVEKAMQELEEQALTI
jgi:dTDP-L-rhamnose 4-epimerase